MAVKFTEVEHRAKSNTRRIDKLEQQTEAINSMAQSLAVLLEKIGGTKEEMIAVGDGFNDLSMIQYAGLGVAMANAQEPVRQAADYITLSNEEDGVAAVVEKFMM